MTLDMWTPAFPEDDTESPQHLPHSRCIRGRIENRLEAQPIGNFVAVEGQLSLDEGYNVLTFLVPFRSTPLRLS